MDRALWISLPSPVVLIGADDCVIDMNPAGERRYDYADVAA